MGEGPSSQESLIVEDIGGRVLELPGLVCVGDANEECRDERSEWAEA